MPDAFDRIAKRFVHKHHDENVCITPLRRELPRRIGASAVAADLLARAPEPVRALLDRWYPPVGEARMLADVPLEIRDAELAAALRALPLPARELIGRCYVLDARRGVRTLRHDVDEREARGLLAALAGQPFLEGAALDERSRRELSAWLEPLPGAPQDVYWCQLVCDLDHAFFFEHPQEHVPGMLLVEACRQMVEAAWHQFGRAPFGDVFVIDTMHVSFRAYVELDAPCLLRLIPRARVGKAGTWEAIEPHLEVHQRGVQVGSFGGKGRLIPASCFSLLRETTSAANSLCG